MEASKDKTVNEKVNESETASTDNQRQSPAKINSKQNDNVYQGENKAIQISNNLNTSDNRNEGIHIGTYKSLAIDVPLVVGSENKSQMKTNASMSLGSSSPGFTTESPGQQVFISGSPGQGGLIPGSPGSTNFIAGSPSQQFSVSCSPGQFNISPGHFGYVPGSPGQPSFVAGSPKFISGSPSKGGLVFNFDDKQRQLLFDIAVIHECNLDRKFLVDPKHEPPKNLIEVLSNKINDEFWDRLEKQLAEDPPEFDEALNLVNDIKQGLNSILLPWHVRIREEIGEVLDQDLIKQQAENGVFDFTKCANYIINLMAKLCAPIRDEGIEELKKVEGIIPSFKAIFAMLNLMRIDMINYHLIAFRGELLRNGRKYERDKFDQYVKLSGCNLVLTQSWLNKYCPVESDKDKKVALVKAFLDLLEWPEARLKLEMPEPLVHDVHRILALADEYFSLIVTASIIVISGGYFSGKAPFDDAFKTSLKDNLLVLLNGVNSYSLVERVMPNITEQIVKMVKDRHKSNPTFSPEVERTSLINLLTNINSSHPVWNLMKSRINDAVIALLTTPKEKLQSITLNSSLLYLTREIQKFAVSFSFLFHHTLYVYGDYMYKYLSANNTDLEK